MNSGVSPLRASSPNVRCRSGDNPHKQWSVTAFGARSGPFQACGRPRSRPGRARDVRHWGPRSGSARLQARFHQDALLLQGQADAPAPRQYRRIDARSFNGVPSAFAVGSRNSIVCAVVGGAGFAGMARVAHVTPGLTLPAAASVRTQTNPDVAPLAWYGMLNMRTGPATAPCRGLLPSLNPADQ